MRDGTQINIIVSFIYIVRFGTLLDNKVTNYCEQKSGTIKKILRELTTKVNAPENQQKKFLCPSTTTNVITENLRKNVPRLLV